MVKRALLFLLFIPFISTVKGQYISEVLEYKPAPGQYINTTTWGTPSSAQSIIGTMSGTLNLGAFGGYVVFKFENPVENHANNPFGIDFVVYGNPIKNTANADLNNNVTWAEPGIVSVMKDENGNGLPDDTWYELAGSDYFFSTTTKNYSITYTNPGGTTAADVPWTDNQGNSGSVLANAFHAQAYYPLAENFTNVDATSYSLSGTSVQDFVDTSNPSNVTYAGRPWGYADNNLKNGYNTLPDNPYTDNVEEGAGGDSFDISWAVDTNGNYVDLDQVDFIKIHTATLANAGWLGEVSTEITGAFDVEPVSIDAWESTSLVLNNIPLQVSISDTYLLEAAFFDKGRKVEVDDLTWNASPEGLVSIDANNRLTVTNAGTVTLTAQCTYDGSTYSESMEATIVAPASIEITEVSTTIRVGEKYLLEAEVVDQNENTISGMSLIWTSSNSNINVVSENDESYLAGLEPGTAWLTVSPNGYPEIKDSVEITILEAQGTTDVYLSIKTDDETFIPKTKITVANYDLTPFVQNANHGYGISDVSNITAAHAIASVFDNVSFESDLRYRDTESEGLYIYKLPVLSGSFATNYYGYGNLGADNENYSCWMVQIGENTYYKNLEDIQLFADDEITVYYVEDLTQNWTVNELTTSVYEVRVGEEVELSLNAVTSFLYSDIIVMEDSREAIANADIMVDDVAYVQDGSTLITDNEGKATLKIEEAGSYEISAAGESFMLEVTPGTAVESIQTESISVYPIPANNFVRIHAPEFSGSTQIKVFELSGKVMHQDVISNISNEVEIATAKWENGVYLLQLTNKGITTTRKIIVKH